MTIKWRFDDLTDNTFAIFDVNPDTGGTPSRQMNLTTVQCIAPGGNAIVFEGAEQPQQLNFSGQIITQAELDMFNTWFTKKHQVQLTDDLGRIFMILFTQFTPKRIRSNNFWRHSYDVSAIIVNSP